MMPKHIAIAALFCVASFLQSAHATQPDAGLSTILGTKLTHLDTNGDGVEDLIREFDATGRLVRVTYIQAGTPAVYETVEFRQSPETVVRTIEHENNHKRVLVQRITEHFSKPGRLATRETLLSAHKDGTLDQRRLERFEGVDVVSETFSLKGQTWVVASHAVRAGFHPEAANDLLSGYVQCRIRRHPDARSSDCAQVSPDIANLDHLDLQSYTELPCRDGEDISLPSGYRIDPASCSNSAAIAKLTAATEQTRNQMLSCLKVLNPMFANQYNHVLFERSPRLRCTSGMGSHLDEEICGTEDSDAVRDCREHAPQRQATSAFCVEARPNDIYLTGIDPLRESNRSRDSYSRQAASTIFHETMHAAGHDGGTGHNHGDFGDEVYGCQGLCGGPEEAWRITREGCRACITTAGNNAQLPIAANLCARFPKAAIISKLWAVEDIASVLATCYRKSTANSCSARLTSLLAKEQFKDVCPAAPASDSDAFEAWQSSCINQMRATASRLVRAAGTGVTADEFRLTLEYFNNAGGSLTNYPASRNRNGQLAVVTDNPDSHSGKLRSADPRNSVENQNATEIRERRQLMIAFMVNDGFCAEIEQPEMTETRFRQLRAQYESVVPTTTTGYRFTDGLVPPIVLRPRTQRQQTVTLAQARQSPVCRSERSPLWAAYANSAVPR